MAKMKSAGGEVRTVPKFIWHEPPGCTTPRGWCRLAKATHPDRGKVSEHTWDYFVDNGGLGCGNYLQYTTHRGPDGEPIHAAAYVYACGPDGTSTSFALGAMWVRTIEEAKRFIQGNIRAYLGLPREATEEGINAKLAATAAALESWTKL